MIQLTQQQTSLCTELLSKLNPGFLPIEIFTQIARLVRLPIVVVIPTRFENGQLEIGLIKRKETDLWWPNMWHVPGTVFRSTDTMDSCIKRLLNDEIDISKCDTPIFRDFVENQNERGSEVIFVHSVENCRLKPLSEVKWFQVKALPKKLVKSELNAITKLRKHFSEV